MLKKLAILAGAAGVIACGENNGVVDPVEVDETADLHRVSSNTTYTYEVTITNLTTGQPLSPGVIFTHRGRTSFLRGHASEGLRAIAENGDPSVAAMELSATKGVFDVVTTAAPIHRIGGPGPETLTTTITARGKARYLSMGLMLICTNDGVAGLNRVKLPRSYKAKTYFARAYDAGTELNEETYATIVPPCFAIGPTSGPGDGNDRTPEYRRIKRHRGIAGIADLDPELHGWRGPIAQVTVRRMK